MPPTLDLMPETRLVAGADPNERVPRSTPCGVHAESLSLRPRDRCDARGQARAMRKIAQAELGTVRSIFNRSYMDWMLRARTGEELS